MFSSISFYTFSISWKFSSDIFLVSSYFCYNQQFASCTTPRLLSLPHMLYLTPKHLFYFQHFTIRPPQHQSATIFLTFALPKFSVLGTWHATPCLLFAALPPTIASFLPLNIYFLTLHHSPPVLPPTLPNLLHCFFLSYFILALPIRKCLGKPSFPHFLWSYWMVLAFLARRNSPCFLLKLRLSKTKL